MLLRKRNALLVKFELDLDDSLQLLGQKLDVKCPKLNKVEKVRARMTFDVTLPLAATRAILWFPKQIGNSSLQQRL